MIPVRAQLESFISTFISSFPERIILPCAGLTHVSIMQTGLKSSPLNNMSFPKTIPHSYVCVKVVFKQPLFEQTSVLMQIVPAVQFRAISVLFV